MQLLLIKKDDFINESERTIVYNFYIVQPLLS